MSRAIVWTQQESRLALAGAALLLTLAMGAVQHATPSNVSYTSFYLLLTGAMAWLGGPIPGLVAALTGAGLTLGMERLWGESPVPPSTAWFNFLTRSASYAGVVWIVEGWRRSTRELERRVALRTAELRQQVAEHQETEGRLRESMERFSQLAENISEVFWLNNPATRQIMYVSPAYEKVWGRSCASLYAAPQSWLDSIHSDDRSRVAQAVPGQVEGRYDETYRIVRADGTQRWIRDRGFPIRNAGGKVVRIAGIAEDITEWKQVEGRLSLQARVLEKMAEGVALVGSDYLIRFTNAALDEMLAYTPGELVGQSVEIMSGRSAEETTRRTAEITASVRGRGIWSGEFMLRRKDNTMMVAEARISGLVLEGQPYFVAVFQDVTDRKRAEQQLAETLDLNQKITAASSVGIVAYRASGQCVLANEAVARILGAPTERVLEQNFLQIDSWKKSGLLDLAQDVLSQRQPRAGEFHLVTTFGKKLWLDIRAATFVSGGEFHLLLMVEDATERKRSEALLELQRDVSRTLSSMNDLKTACDYLLEVATGLEGVDCGGVYLADERGGDLALVANRGLSPEFIQRSYYYGADTHQAAQAKEGQPLYGRPADLDPPGASACQREGIIALGVVPMRDEARLVAVLVVGGRTQESIPTPTRLTIEAIAGQAQGAIGRIRAEQEQRQTEARLRTFIAGAPIVLLAADRKGLITFEEGRALSTMSVVPGQHVGQSLAEVQGRLPITVEHVQRALAGEEVSATAELAGLAFDCRYSPVRDESGQCSGCISVATDITERVRLERQILEISDREQARLGQDIHDGLCQQLVSVAFDANSLAQRLAGQAPSENQLAERIALLLDEAITDCRQLARGLYPVSLEAEGLGSALEELAATTRTRFAIDCEMLTPAPFTTRDLATATHLYRIAQEAVNNAVKHSGARQVRIRLTASEHDLRLEVSDDGQGIGEPPVAPAGMGLHIMEYRARSIGGSLRVAPQPGGGTVVSCCVPMERV